jgi:Leucine-rich repeat (LRR) protein
MKRIAPLIFLAVVAALLTAAWFLFGKQVLTAYYSGTAERARAEGRHEAAANAIERLIKLDPESPDLRRRAAELLAESGAASRAEYHLREGISLGGPRQAALIAALSELYVRQDKLLDAVALLDGVRGLASGEVSAMRPDPPEPDTEPGRFENPVVLGFTVPEGHMCYVSLTEEYPSTAAPWNGPISLPSGETEVRAVAVDPDGVVSELWTGVYTLDNLNFPIVFQEPAIEAAVRAAIGRPEGGIYSRDLTGVTQLRIEEEHAYTTLDDLSALPNLEILSLRGENTSCDISAVAGLTKLRGIRMEAMRLDSASIEALSGLSALEILVLPRNQLTALTALSTLTALKTLDISGNAVIDLTPLAGLTGLTSLDASQNSVGDLSPLKSLTKLEFLNVAGGRATSLNGLAPLINLVELDISGNQVRDLRALEDMTKLERLNASNNAVERLNPLRGLTELTELNLASNGIESLEPLESLRALKYLTLNANAVVSLAPLKECRALETLDVDKNQVESVEPLRGLPNLRELRVEGNKLRSLTPLLECPALKSVYAFDNNRISVSAEFRAKGIAVYA